MTREEIAWLAGLLEGEGCFSWNGVWSISVFMTDRDVIEHVADLWRTNVHETKTSSLNGSKVRPAYSTQLSRRADVIPMLKALHPYMGERRKAKIEELLALHEQHPPKRPRKPILNVS